MAGLAQTGTIHIPRPHANESPVGYANRIAQWYLEWNGGKKQLGQFFTSTEVAYFMAQLCARTGDFMRVLDPGAGTGILACALCETLKCDIYLEAYETDPELAGCLEHSLDYAQRWMHAHGLNLRFKVVPSDFVMARAWALDWSVNEYFDVAILNPPYFKLSKSDPRAKAALSIVHGQPNIYAIFMGISAALLKPGGQLVCITPRSYAAGQYFHRFASIFLAG